MKFEPAEIPFVDKAYTATEGKFSFIVSYIKDYGWSASYKDREYTGPQSSTFIANSAKDPFKTRDQAEAACRHALKKLKLS